ncbi:hypothetical protein EDB80DRAFT_870259 [Ilyonectria destructans]|nr:hypothetical protein EDB80DRAFT_870259 [Ilyonectria destructans]
MPLPIEVASAGYRVLSFCGAAFPYIGVSVGFCRRAVEVQGYVGLFTWLVVQYDDIVGQRNQMVEEAGHFQQRFFQGKAQPNNLLERIASMIREAHIHFDPVMANLVQISVLKFLTSNLLERHDGTSASREANKLAHFAALLLKRYIMSPCDLHGCSQYTD